MASRNDLLGFLFLEEVLRGPGVHRGEGQALDLATKANAVAVLIVEFVATTTDGQRDSPWALRSQW